MIKAKFHAPSMHPYIVSRKKVLEKLRQIPNYKLTSIVAPAGYEKTTAILSWLQNCGLDAAWFSLDSYDNHPASFWRHVFAALEGIVPGIGKDAEYVFSSRELMDARMQIHILLDRLTGDGPDFLLVLDDLHIVSDPSILSGLSELVRYMPKNMHMVFVSRTEPPLMLSKQRMAGEMLRLTEKDLRFDEGDIDSFYRARGHLLKSEDLKKVESYTEGWAAALVAVALSMERERSGSDAIAALPRASRDIDEYLRDEVVSAWPPEKLEFAKKTCILDTLFEPLCDAVTGGFNARRMLREISAENGFLTALGEQSKEYRYHPLFSSFLKGLLSDAAPGEVSELHIRAARWFSDRGLIPEAIEHLLLGGAHGEALFLIERKTDYMVFQNEFGTLLSWIGRLPENMREESFQAAFIYAAYYLAAGRFELSREWLTVAKERAAGERYCSDPE